MKNLLILTTVSGFLDKFEKGNIRILQEMGFTVHYAANMNEQHYLYDEEQIRKIGVHLHHIDIARSPYMIHYNFKALCQLRKIIKKNHICAIHCHTPVGGMLGRMMGCWFRKLKVVYTAHGFHFYKGAPILNNTIFRLMERIFAHFTDIIVVINKEDYANAKKFHMKKGGKVYRIPGVGLDKERFTPMTLEQRAEARKELGIRQDDYFIVSVGEVNENKNQQIILRTLDKMRKDGEDISHIRYGICGDGFFRERIRNMIQELNLEDIVIMYGYCRDVRKYLGCADVSVFPSRREGLGMAGLEALSMGIPLLASENRGTKEYLQPGINGYFCRSDNVQDWVQGLKKIQDMLPEKLTKMKQMCRTSVELFTKENTDSMMQLVYQDLNKRLGYDKDERTDEDQCDHGSLQPTGQKTTE